MKPSTDWQVREMLDMLVRSREFQFIAQMTVQDVLRDIALITLDDLIKTLESTLLTVGEILDGKTVRA